MHTSKKILLIQKFFRKNINIDQNLFENNFLDSLKVLDLINFLEKKTKKKISPTKVNQKSFSTIRDIAKIF
jgi:acyl carrier protein